MGESIKLFFAKTIALMQVKFDTYLKEVATEQIRDVEPFPFELPLRTSPHRWTS